MNARKVLAFSVGPIGAAALGLITLPIVAWLFSPEDIGRLTMLQVTVSFALLCFSLGLDQAYVREFHEVKDKPSLLKAVFIPGFAMLIIASLCVTLSPWSPSLLLFGKDSFYITVLLYSMIFLTFASRFLSLILRMQERGLAYSMSQLLPKLLFLMIIIFFILIDSEPLFLQLITANFISVLTVFIIYLWNTRKDWKPALFAIIDRPKQKEMLCYALPLIGSGIAFWGLTTMDRIFLRGLSNFEELGVYSISVSLAGFALVFRAIFSTIWAPIVYKWSASKVNPKKIKNIIDIVCIIVVMIWSISGVFSWLLNYILPKEFGDVQYIFLSAMAYPLLYSLSEATGIGIGIRRKTVLSLVASILAIVINLIGNTLLIPIYGASGAAIASSIAFFVFFMVKTEAGSRVWISFERYRMYGIIFTLLFFSILFNVAKFHSLLISGVYIFIILMCLILFNKEVRCIYKNIISRDNIF